MCFSIPSFLDFQSILSNFSCHSYQFEFARRVFSATPPHWKWKNSPVMWNINIFLTCEIGKITNDVENKLKLKIHFRPQMKIWNDQWRMLVYNFKSILIISFIWFRFRSILKIFHRFNYKWRDAFWKIPFAFQDKWFSNLRFQIF